MGQPAIIKGANGRMIARFGNMPLPNGQGTLANIDLNDGVFSKVVGLDATGNPKQLGVAALLYRGRGVHISEDYGAGKISLPMVYLEDSTHQLGALLAQLAQAGEQQLTFDLLTCTLVKFAGISSRQVARSTIPLGWKYQLDLVGKDGWWRDIAATTLGAVTITTDSGHNFNITYAGSVWAEPVWTFHVPATNGVVINQIQLKNTLSGEVLMVNFLSQSAIPASTLRDVVIDSGAMTAVCTQTGESYDVSGSFPNLYPPAGQVNTCQIVVVPASGSSSGCTIAATHYPRWML